MNSFSSELGVRFPIQLEASHIIPEAQVHVHVSRQERVQLVVYCNSITCFCMHVQYMLSYCNCTLGAVTLNYVHLQGIPYSMVAWRRAMLQGCEQAILATMSLPH